MIGKDAERPIRIKRMAPLRIRGEEETFSLKYLNWVMRERIRRPNRTEILVINTSNISALETIKRSPFKLLNTCVFI